MIFKIYAKDERLEAIKVEKINWNEKHCAFYDTDNDVFYGALEGELSNLTREERNVIKAMCATKEKLTNELR